MTVCDVLELGDPRLRVRSAEVPAPALDGEALQDLVKDLIETMRARNGAGIAAPQIGVAQRVCVIEVNDNPRYPYKPTIPLTVLINPTLERIGEETISVIEGCLSVPNLRGRVERAARVRIRALDERGRRVELHAEGLTAGTLQHELDHLDGLLFVDHVTDPTTLTTIANYQEFTASDFALEAAAINQAYPQPLRVEVGSSPSL